MKRGDEAGVLRIVPAKILITVQGGAAPATLPRGDQGVLVAGGHARVPGVWRHACEDRIRHRRARPAYQRRAADVPVQGRDYRPARIGVLITTVDRAHLRGRSRVTPEHRLPGRWCQGAPIVAATVARRLRCASSPPMSRARWLAASAMRRARLAPPMGPGCGRMRLLPIGGERARRRRIRPGTPR